MSVSKEEKEAKGGVEPRTAQDGSGQGLIEEIKELFFKEAERQAWHDEKIDRKMFNRDEVIAEVYDFIAYSKYYSSQRERRRELLRTINELDDDTLRMWQEEIYEKWDEEVQ